MYAYLGLTEDGRGYQLCISTARLNPAGTRLERGRQQRLPEEVYALAKNPDDPRAAIAGLIHLQGFFDGTERGPGAPTFGQPLATRRRRKGDE
jgi:hypothetical protein